MATNVPLELISHTRKICSLYKRTLRNIESWCTHRVEIRVQCVMERPVFDEIIKEKDLIKANQMIEEKERELFKFQHYQPKKFPYSPGGTAYNREVIPPDWVLDYWHPLEKAQYPDFFAKREIRKQQYIEMWERKYGPPPKEHH